MVSALASGAREHGFDPGGRREIFVFRTRFTYVICRDDIKKKSPPFGSGRLLEAPYAGRVTHVHVKDPGPVS